jgi:hypothetical protein
MHVFTKAWMHVLPSCTNHLRKNHTHLFDIGVCVSELVGWVRSVVLINVYLDLENPGGGRDFGWEGI